jgi:hypothetical protein
MKKETVEKEYWWEDAELYFEFKQKKKALLLEMRNRYKEKYGKTSACMESGGALMGRYPRD